MDYEGSGVVVRLMMKTVKYQIYQNYGQKNVSNRKRRAMGRYRRRQKPEDEKRQSSGERKGQGVDLYGVCQ